ncbi:MAG TPA: hypothetical protein VLR52_00670 [Bacteroidales bacterium]|nr:hypothetical protein [Bacteroidales bacterium]
MKTLKYMITGLLLILLIPFSIAQIPVKNKQVITIRSVTQNASPELLKASKEIMERRLASIQLRDVKIIRNDTKSELVISVRDTISRERLLEVLLSRGHFNIYETMNRQEVLKSFSKKSSGCIQDVFSMLHIQDTTHAVSQELLGVADSKDTISLNACLSSADVRALLPDKSRLLWSVYPDENKLYRLYCLSLSDRPFSEQDILEAHSDFSQSEYPTLNITFKEDVRDLWKEATRRNINQPMAFVIDDKVYAAPRIVEVIPHGKIALSGSGFSKSEVRKLSAIISNGALPLEFKVVTD